MLRKLFVLGSLLVLLAPAAVAEEERVPGCVALNDLENVCTSYDGCVGVFYVVTNGQTWRVFGWGVCLHGGVCTIWRDDNAGIDQRSCVLIA